MKKVLLTLLAVIVVIGALGAAGFAGYRVGYNQGAIASGNGTAAGPFWHMNPNQMPMHRFNNNFGPNFNFNRPSRMMGRGAYGMNFFSPFHFIWNIAILGLVIWFVYWLFTKSGWHITRSTGNPQDSAPKTEGN